MKKYYSVLFTAVFLKTSLIFAQYSGGTGTALDPYQIANTTDLSTLAATSADWGANFVQTANIDFNNVTPANHTPIGSSGTPFTGVYDGGNFNIRALSVSQITNYAGMFGFVNGGEIKDLNLSLLQVVGGDDFVGGLAGYATGATITNVEITGTTATGISGKYNLGGLIGEANNCVISNCDANVTVASSGGTNAGSNIGGLIGVASTTGSGSISNCNVQGTVTSDGGEDVGGLIGECQVNVTSCSSTATVTGVDFVGGLIGYPLNCTISDSSYTSENDGAVSGTNYVGGFVGDVENCTITGCFFSGLGSDFAPIQLSGNNFVGGFAGRVTDGSNISSSYAIAAVSGNSQTGGFIGRNEASDVTNCYVAANVTATGIEVGGFIGISEDSGGVFPNVTQSYSVAIGDYFIALGFTQQDVVGFFGANIFNHVTGNGTSTDDVGGFIGENWGLVENCFTRGSVVNPGGSGGWFAAFVANNNGGDSNVTKCYAAGDYTSSTTYPFIYGNDNASSGTDNFYDSNLQSATSAAIGGSNPISTTTAATTVNMKDDATYTAVGWDFSGETTNGTNDYWGIYTNANDGYPILSSTYLSQDITPIVRSVNAPADATYDTSENLDFTVNFNTDIFVNTTGGTPQLALTVGSTTRQAVYQSGTGTQNLVFRYTVQNGDIDVDGVTVGTLAANGGTLRDGYDVDATLDLNNVDATDNVVVFTSDVTYTNANGYQPADPSGLDIPNYDLTVIDGTAVISAATNFNNVTVQPGGVLDLDANITLTTALLFESDATGSGQLADATGATITGNVRVERYFSNNRAFRLAASPVTTTNFISNNWQQNTHITGAQGTVGQTSADGFDQTATGNPSMFTFNNGYVDSNPDPVEGPDQSPGYTEIPNTNATNLQVGTAYVILVRGDRSIDLSNNTSFGATTLSATGTAHTGRYPSAPGSSVSLSQENDYWSLVANPYQAKVDYNLLPKNDLRQDIAVRDPDNNSWQTLTGTNRIIEPGQSFFVQNVASVSSATLYFEEADKATGGSNGGVVVFNDSQEAKLDLELYNQNNERKDILKFRFSSNYNSDLDDNDFGKLINDEENIASYHPNMLRSIDRRNIPQDNEEVLLNLSHYQNTSYELRIKQENWDSNIDVYVKDNYLNTTTQITPDLPYQFNIDTNIPESIAEDRFSLTFDNTTLSTEENTFGNNFRIHPNPTKNGRFSISTPNLIGEVELEITNLLGQKVYNERHNIENQKVQVEVNDLSSGLYIVKVKQEDQSKSVKLIHK